MIHIIKRRRPILNTALPHALMEFTIPDIDLQYQYVRTTKRRGLHGHRGQYQCPREETILMAV